MLSIQIGKRRKFQIALALLWAVLVLVFAATKSAFVSAASGQERITDTPMNEVKSLSVIVSVEPLVDQEFLRLLTEGRFKGIEFGLGAKKEAIISQWGAPDRIQDNVTHELLYYNGKGCYFSIDTTSGQVIAIGLNDFKIGLTPEQVKAVAGTPFSEGEDMMDGGWLTVYRAGTNEVYLHSNDKNSPITSWLLKGQ